MYWNLHQLTVCFDAFEKESEEFNRVIEKFHFHFELPRRVYLEKARSVVVWKFSVDRQLKESMFALLMEPGVKFESTFSTYTRQARGKGIVTRCIQKSLDGQLGSCGCLTVWSISQSDHTYFMEKCPVHWKLTRLRVSGNILRMTTTGLFLSKSWPIFDLWEKHTEEVGMPELPEV